VRFMAVLHPKDPVCNNLAILHQLAYLVILKNQKYLTCSLGIRFLERFISHWNLIVNTKGRSGVCLINGTRLLKVFVNQARNQQITKELGKQIRMQASGFIINLSNPSNGKQGRVQRDQLG